MSNFPQELLFDILIRVPPKTLLRCLCVSKAWSALIRDECFIKAQLQHSIRTNSSRTILFRSFCAQRLLLAWYKPTHPQKPSGFFSLPFSDERETSGELTEAVKIEQPLQRPDANTKVMGCSIHGLVCIYSNVDWDIALWNPSIQKFKKIPFPVFWPPPYAKMRSPQFGFGYDSASDDFKIVGIMEFFDNDDCVVCNQVKVFSLKSNSWKMIQNMPCCGFKLYSDNGVFFNGSLSWLMCKKVNVDANKLMILSLDLGSEEFRQIPTPVHKEDAYGVTLEVLRGLLCLCVHSCEQRYDVWMMREYGMAESWFLRYSIVQEAVPWSFDNCKPLVVSKNGDMVVLKKGGLFNSLHWFDLLEMRAKPIEIPKMPHHFEATICVGSLCLLDGRPVTSM